MFPVERRWLWDSNWIRFLWASRPKVIDKFKDYYLMFCTFCCLRGVGHLQVLVDLVGSGHDVVLELGFPHVAATAAPAVADENGDHHQESNGKPNPGANGVFLREVVAASLADSVVGSLPSNEVILNGDMVGIQGGNGGFLVLALQLVGELSKAPVDSVHIAWDKPKTWK